MRQCLLVHRGAFALGLALWFSAPVHAAGFPWKTYAKKPPEWFGSEEAKQIAAHVLSYQSAEGSWPKNVDTGAALYRGASKDLHGTFDNDATTGELRFLARMINHAPDERYVVAFNKGLSHILLAQYPTGGWPQFYPPGRQYHRHITFNDDCMVNILLLLRDVSRLQEFRFVKDEQREAAAKAFDRGIQCILRCQIIVAGNKTVWCAQHDEKDFQPRPGRSYELVSLSGGESVGIVRLLMSIERPTPEVIASVQGAVAWFEAAKLPGIKEVKKEDPNTVKGYDKVVIRDATAPPMWARFYQISTNKPIFSDRDGVAKANLADIGYERRNGYAWLGYWPRDLLAKDYPAWKQKLMNPSPSD